MFGLLRAAITFPIGLLWDRLTRNEFDEFIAEQRQRFLDMAEGD